MWIEIGLELTQPTTQGEGVPSGGHRPLEADAAELHLVPMGLPHPLVEGQDLDGGACPTELLLQRAVLAEDHMGLDAELLQGGQHPNEGELAPRELGAVVDEDHAQRRGAASAPATSSNSKASARSAQVGTG